MNTKKEYKAPELNIVEFKVEKGFAISQNAGVLGDYNDRGTITSDRSRWNPFHVKYGAFSNNNDDWD